jgi:hypothetical protein
MAPPPPAVADKIINTNNWQPSDQSRHLICLDVSITETGLLPP